MRREHFVPLRSNFDYRTARPRQRLRDRIYIVVWIASAIIALWIVSSYFWPSYEPQQPSSARIQ